MIVIALAALAYTWFSGTFSSLTGTASTSVSQTTGAMTTNFEIESAKNTSATTVSVTVRNVGAQTIDLSLLRAYVSELPYATTASGTLATSVVQNFNVNNVPNPCGQILKLTVGGGYTQTVLITGC